MKGAWATVALDNRRFFSPATQLAFPVLSQEGKERGSPRSDFRA